MKWTTNKPTESGFYWIFTKGLWQELWIIEVAIEKNRVTFSDQRTGYEVRLEHITHWIGPLEEPVLPE